jgi:hypothetical protein
MQCLHFLFVSQSCVLLHCVARVDRGAGEEGSTAQAQGRFRDLAAVCVWCALCNVFGVCMCEVGVARVVRAVRVVRCACLRLPRSVPPHHLTMVRSDVKLALRRQCLYSDLSSLYVCRRVC